ncbi:MAG TPA: glycosyltransferase family 4 protein [Pyrinomonadaceae bacterium]|nr:glycosyltransferase family 4 protein [Pyrinomonadaceae bacterium]
MAFGQYELRILQISSASSFGGGERHVADLINALAERGHDLYLAVRSHSPLLEHVHLSPAQIKTLPLRNALDVQSAHELARFVRRHEIEVVHAHMARDYSLAAYATRRNRDTKFIVTRHVLFPLNRLHRQTLAGAHRVIAVSNAVASELRKERITRDDQITVVHNGIDTDRFAQLLNNFDRAEFLRSKGLPTDGLFVGSIGELRTLKRHDDFIRAAAKIADRFPQTHFVLAGVDTSPSGEVRKQLEHLVKQLRLNDRFHFLGWLDDAEKLLAALDVFVSASETESFGLAIAEAMAAGTAVVATATDGAQEVIDDQQSGLLVPIGDPTGLAEAIAALLASAEQRKQIGRLAQREVARRFSLQRMVDEIERIYAG